MQLSLEGIPKAHLRYSGRLGTSQVMDGTPEVMVRSDPAYKVMSPSLWGFPWIWKFRCGGAAAALIATFLLPDFQTCGDPCRLDTATRSGHAALGQLMTGSSCPESLDHTVDQSHAPAPHRIWPLHHSSCLWGQKFGHHWLSAGVINLWP